MRVALITNNLPPVIDGVGDFTDLIASVLCLKGMEVLVICRKDIKPIISNANVQVSPLVGKWNYKGFTEALNVLENYKPDYIIFQFVPYAFNRWGIPLGLIGIVRSVKHLAKIGIVFHETFIRFDIWPIQTNFVAILQRYILKKLRKLNPISITSIDRYEHQLKSLGFGPVHLIPIPANIQYDEDSEPDKNDLKKIISPNNEKIIVALGNRDYTMLIGAFKRISEKRKNIKLVILGNQDSHWENMPDGILQTGVLSRKEIFDYLCASDLYISFDPVINGKGGTSNKSGSLASALAAGLPVIGFKGDMNNQLLSLIPDLFLVEFEKTSIENALLNFIDHPKSSANNDFWRKHLSVEMIADDYIEKIFIA